MWPSKITTLLNSPLIKIKGTDLISFRQIVKVIVPLPVPKNGKTEKKALANLRTEYSWTEFKQFYIDYLTTFVVHYNRWIHQHQTRRNFIDPKIGRIPSNVCVSHIDFIHKIPVEYKENGNTMWADGQKVAFTIRPFKKADPISVMTQSTIGLLQSNTCGNTWHSESSISRKNIGKN